MMPENPSHSPLDYATLDYETNDNFRIGTAGWNVPKQYQDAFPPAGSHLQRYAQRLNAVEINSSFYRDHKGSTYAKWRDAVPDSFRFAVKLHRDLTHLQKLENPAERLETVLGQIQNLGAKMGVLLIQLPPSLKFNPPVARTFFKELRRQYKQTVALEPRHITWTSEAAMELLVSFDIGRVVADPDVCPLSEEQLGLLKSPAYFRWHGSPEIYKSLYSPEALEQLRLRMQRARQPRNGRAHPATDAHPVWCIFDNTTFGFAAENALDLTKRFGRPLTARTSQGESQEQALS
jgi:uncharacterized protein YecE (DUF72 family)